MSIRIDKEFESLIPPLSDEEFKQLEDNCVKDGIRDPLVLWRVPNGDDILIDGHNRWKIAAHHTGIPFETVHMTFDNRDEVKAWIIKNQFGRRNLSAYDRSVLALKLKPLIAEKAKGRQIQGGKEKVVQKSAQAKTRDELAKVAGVSHDTIHKVEKIEAEASESTKQAVREGKMSINQAYNSTFPKRQDPVKAAKAEHEQFLKNKDAIVDFKAAKVDQANQKIINNAMMQDVLKLIDNITRFGLEYGPIKLEAWAASIDDDTASHTAGMIKNCHMVLKNITDAIEGR